MAKARGTLLRDPRLMFLVDGYEIAYDSEEQRFYARPHFPTKWGIPTSTAGREPWRVVEGGEVTTDFVNGVQITKPLVLGEAIAE